MKGKKTFVRILALILAILMVLSVLYGVLDSALAVDLSLLQELQEKKAAIDQKKNELAAQLASKEYEQLTLVEKKAVQDELIDLLNEEIDNINSQVSAFDYEILVKNAIISSAEEDVIMCESDFVTRIRIWEENGVMAYCQLLLAAEDFPDFLKRMDMVREVITYDNQVKAAYKKAKTAVTEAYEALENVKADQDQIRAQLTDIEFERDSVVENAATIIAEVEQGGHQSDFEAIYSAESEFQLELDVVGEKMLQREAAGLQVPSTGAYVWPVPEYRNVNTLFGTKWNEAYHMFKTHYGVDIPAPYGAPVTAADGGIVAVADYDNTYGNYVVINHGNGKMTLYSHLSEYKVKENATVVQGQVIGYVGCSGIAAGSHLHFETREKTGRVNPLNYFMNYTVLEGAV